MGKARSTRGAEWTLDPAAAFSVAEAARLVDRAEADIEQLLSTGSLLSESRRQGGKDVHIIRAIDLQEAFPGASGLASGLASGAAESGVDRSATGAESPMPATPLGLAPESIVDAVRTSGATRDALIGLCEDMETRLDLAERERQASTAALLMAQRRVLDLEVQARRQPWARAGGICVAAASAAAVVIALRAPAAARKAAVEELAPLRNSAIQGLREAGLVLASQWEESLGEQRAAADQERARFEETLRAARSSVELSSVAAQDLAATSAASFARVEGEAKGVLEAVLTERAEAALERKELLAALDDLERRLLISEDSSRKRSAELEVAHDNAGRDRIRFRERLGDAERLLEDARLAMGASRRAQADERERLRQTTERLEVALGKFEARGATQPASSPRVGEPIPVSAGPSKRLEAPATEGNQEPATEGVGQDGSGKALPEGPRGGASSGSTVNSILRALFG